MPTSSARLTVGDDPESSAQGAAVLLQHCQVEKQPDLDRRETPLHTIGVERQLEDEERYQRCERLPDKFEPSELDGQLPSL